MEARLAAQVETRADAIDAARSTVVLVDYQQRLMPAISGGQAAIAAAALLAGAARELGVRVAATEQNVGRLGPTADVLRGLADTIVHKTHFDACDDGLGDVVARDGGGHVVIAGCESHVCLLQTTLGLLRRSHRVWVVELACGSRRPSEHRLAMQRLAQAGATIVSPEMVLFEWLGDCNHPQFRALLARIKDASLGSQARAVE